MHIKEFARNCSARLREVVETGTPLVLTRYRRDFVALVPADEWAEAKQALDEKRAREGVAA